MDHPNRKIPHRPIGGEDDERLNQLWNRIPDGTPPSEKDLKDVWRRIAGRERKRIWKYVATIGSMAAMIATAVWFLWPYTAPQEPAVYAQLQEMGVKVDHPEVTLSSDDSRTITLQDAALMVASHDSMALRTAAGRDMTMGNARKLRLEVPAGKTFKMTLADGTLVWLNAESVLEYPASFKGKSERRVRLTGEAFFEVKHDARHPFFVELGEKEAIKVLGTSFNVNAYPENRERITTLASGRISYHSGWEGKDRELHPNQQLRMDCLSGRSRLTQVDAAEYTAWREGIIFFENEKLTALARRLSRIYGIQIQVSPQLENYAFSGRISFNRGIDYITRLMGETTGISCQVENGVIILK